MGILTVPRHTGEMKYIMTALRVYATYNDWMPNDLFIPAQSKALGEPYIGSDRTHYTKDAEIPRYFGFAERKEPGKIHSDVRITNSGKQFLDAWDENDLITCQDLLMRALENTTFGRNNDGCGSDSDVEAPIVCVQSSLLLDGINKSELAYILDALNSKTEDFTSACLKIIKSRTMGTQLPAYTMTEDQKYVQFMRNVGFFEEHSSGRVIIKLSESVKRKYYDRIIRLNIYNDEELKYEDSLDDEYQITDSKISKDLIQYILHGAPGTGKTFRAKNDAAAIVSGRTDGWDKLSDDERERVGFVQFHPSYDYTDFVEGIKPDPNKIGSFKRYDGIFKTFCKKALNDQDNNYVFIIDEINRGELSKIFGELFYAIEPSYRGDKGRIKTQYNYLIDNDTEEGSSDVFKDGFFVPKNVYIIGTMNDVDRGVESMDFAIRRRFSWIEITTEESLKEMKLSNDAIAKLEAINHKLEDYNFSKAYHIGGAYFIDVTDFDQLWELHLKNILSEYLRGEVQSDEKLLKIKEAYIAAHATVPNDLPEDN